MKIGYVLKRFPRLSETFIVNELLAMESLGIPLEIFSLKLPRPEPRHELLAALRAPVTYLPDPPAIPDCAVRQNDPQEPHGRQADADAAFAFKAEALARLAAGRGVTHLHAHFGTGATRVAMLASRLAGLPYSFTAHAKDIYHQDVDPAALVEKVRGARFVVTVSDYNRRYLATRFGPALARRIVRLYNGLDLQRLAPDPAVPREPDLVLGAGRLVEKKGFTHLVQAFALLRDRGVPARCLIVGDGPERGALAERIRRLRLEDVVTLAGAQPQEELLGVMRRAAVFALPCVVSGSGDRDGLPTVLLEALALGLPAISTALPGIDEIICDRRTGLLVPPGDAARLADAIAEVLTASGLRGQLAACGRARAEEVFDIRKNGLILADRFARSASTRPRPAQRPCRVAP
ncbi:MAG: glycosyltransferase [Candidatus Rokubacteria bacterium]|nr:glycosyltransferase [Candidatus Rokubacteria bacterium]